jgi:hypothetical protein
MTMSDKILTQCAVDAYWEEFTYFFAESANPIALCKSVFVENHGKDEAEKIDWDIIRGIFE